jgi:hypothetical protein
VVFSVGADSGGDASYILCLSAFLPTIMNDAAPGIELGCLLQIVVAGGVTCRYLEVGTDDQQHLLVAAKASAPGQERTRFWWYRTPPPPGIKYNVTQIANLR